MIDSLYPTKQKTFNKKVYGFDIETYDKNKRFLCASLYSDDYQKTFFSKREMIEEMKKKRFHNSVIVAHNLAFDFFGLFFGEKEEIEFNPLFRNSDLIIAKTYIYGKDFHRNIKRIDGKRILAYSLVFIDAMNYGNISVEESGNLIGIPKLKRPKFIGKKPKNKKEWDEMIRYNMRDSEVSQKYFKFMISSLMGMGCSFKFTAASSAMSLFTNRYLKERYFVHDIDKLMFQFSGYYGGRCECFARGKFEDYEYYDVNSLYPSVMFGHDYPDPNTLRDNNKNTLLYIDNYEGFSEVDIFCPENTDIPLLPYRNDDKLIFPVGSFHGVYTNIELREAIQAGYVIKKVYRNLYFKKKIRPFDGYVSDLYQKRNLHKSERSPLEKIDKLLLNSLYGKFGEKFIDKDNIIPIPENIEDVRKYDFFEPLNGSYARIKFDVMQPKRWCIPAWAAYVTAYGRIKLWKLLRVSDPLYCDTDSLITRKKYNNSSELGELKLEKHIKDGIIIRPKFYMINDGRKNTMHIKGVGVKLVCHDFKSIMQGNSITYPKFIKFREALRRDLTPNEIISMTKILSLEDDKRVWKHKFDGSLEYSRPICINPSEDLYISLHLPEKQGGILAEWTK